MQVNLTFVIDRVTDKLQFKYRWKYNILADLQFVSSSL